MENKKPKLINKHNSITLLERLEYMNIYGVNLDEATLYVSGEITGDLSTALRMRVQALKKYWKEQLKKELKEITISVNSPGGDATSIAAVDDFYKELKKEGILVNTHAEAICMSAATFLVGGGTGKRTASSSTRFMVHEIQIDGISGTHTQTKAAQQEIDFMVEQCIKLYVDYTINSIPEGSHDEKKILAEWEKRCQKETYFSSEQAKEWGLIDEVI